MAFGKSSSLLSVGVGSATAVAACASILSQVAGGAPILGISGNIPVNIISSGVIGAAGVGLASTGNKMAGVMGLGLVVLALVNGNVNFNGDQAARFGKGVASGVQSAAINAASATQQGATGGKSNNDSYYQYSNGQVAPVQGVSYDGWKKVRPLSAGELEWCAQGNNATGKGLRNCSTGYIWKQQ